MSQTSPADTLIEIDSKLPATIGANTTANSMSVNIASDQLPVSVINPYSAIMLRMQIAQLQLQASQPSAGFFPVEIPIFFAG